jgi:hypothetical protein
MLCLRINEELLDRLGDRRHLDVLDDPNFAGGLPVAHQIGRSRPGTQIEAAADRLAAQRALDPDRSGAVCDCGAW